MSSRTAFSNARIFTGDEILLHKTLLIEGDKIKAIVDFEEIPADYQVIDFSDLTIAPGLIDLQIYGSGGQLFGGKPTVEALLQMETDFLSQGCTGFLATVGTNSSGIVLQAIESAKIYRKKTKGAFLGLHLEGPFLNPKRSGAHPKEYIRKASLTEVKNWIELSKGEIRMITIAPELQDAEVIDYLLSQNIVVSAGHSDATYTEAEKFFNSGIHAATHLFNAMPQIHHREPGLVAAILKYKPFTSIIADGIHISFPVLELAKRELGNKLFLITDAVTETTEGLYPHVFNHDRYSMPDGTLSGSCLTMWKAVKNCVEYAGISTDEALRMASTYPSQLIKTDKRQGYIKPGFRADFFAFDTKLNVQNTCIAGVLD
ncbi:N-acetylglucosamine-6-phosphate deacetylase [Daejeonella oryzae]|uniref:N-acetylglucosamine-6-phosphate deacetylase n=1 Tax=Daejeonella oryzae TaxID=1122943 RepID=UPI0004123A2E|nr:N-acetylglucosamine-6-phosphate deacetylase [Daejeonella oryzae]